MDDSQISYSPSSVTFHFLLTTAIYVAFSFLLIQSVQNQKPLAIYFCIGSMLLLIYPAARFIKCFIAYKSSQPAVILTKDLYIDKTQNIEVAWQDIKDIRMTTFRTSFLAIAVNDNAIIYRQAKNPVHRFFMWTNTLSGEPLMINFSLLKGKNNDILLLIKDYYQRSQVNRDK